MKEQVTPPMTEIAAKIMVEVMEILGLVTKEVKRGRASELIIACLSFPSLIKI